MNDSSVFVSGSNVIREAARSSRVTLSELLVVRESEIVTELLASMRASGRPEPRVRRVPEGYFHSAHGRRAHLMGARVELHNLFDATEFRRRVAEQHRIVALDHLEDPQNVGALLRSAVAFGFDSVLLPKDRTVSLSDTVYEVSAGMGFHVDFFRVTNIRRELEFAKEKGVWVFGADMEGESVYETEPLEPILIVLGSEGKGLSRSVRESAHRLVRVPMSPGVESLNVATTGGILMSYYSQPARPKK